MHKMQSVSLNRKAATLSIATNDEAAAKTDFIPLDLNHEEFLPADPRQLE